MVDDTEGCHASSTMYKPWRHTFHPEQASLVKTAMWAGTSGLAWSARGCWPGGGSPGGKGGGASTNSSARHHNNESGNHVACLSAGSWHRLSAGGDHFPAAWAKRRTTGAWYDYAIKPRGERRKYRPQISLTYIARYDSISSVVTCSHRQVRSACLLRDKFHGDRCRRVVRLDSQPRAADPTLEKIPQHEAIHNRQRRSSWGPSTV